MNRRERRAIAVGAAIIGLTLFVRIAPAAVENVRAWRANGLDAQLTLRRAQEILKGREAVSDSLSEALAQVDALQGKLLRAEDSADAADELTWVISSTAEQAALKITTLRTMSDSESHPLERITAEVQLEGDIRGLSRFLRALETAETILTVNALSVATDDPGAQMEKLKVLLEVSALYQKSGPS